MCPLPPFLFNIILDEVSSQCHRTRKRNKRLKVRKGEVNLFLFIDDLTLEIGNLKESVK
jgi:hypothetical protein